MNCDQTRDALSAALDGESAIAPTETVEHHVAGCPDCRRWLHAAAELQRNTTLRTAPQVPDLADSILASIAASTGHAVSGAEGPRRYGSRVLARWSLAWLALVQMVAAVPVLLGSYPGASIHMAREMGSWDIALAVGFGVAALRPQRAWGMLPLVTVLIGFLTATSLIDITQGNAAVSGEAVHFLELAGLALMWLVAERPSSRRPGSIARLHLA